MKIVSGVAHGVIKLSKQSGNISKEARRRLKWFDYYHANDCNARLTCRHFDISPQTFYRWKRRYHPCNLKTLEAHSHKPKRLRQPTYTTELVEAVLELRELYPRWGKNKLVLLLKDKGVECSASMVGRILCRLKARGLLEEPIVNRISAKRRHRQRPYATRKPKDYVATAPGDIVQVDTLDVRPLPGIVIKQFTSIDVISRWDVLEAHTRATSTAAARYLDTLEQRMPFPVRAIQIDGGSEFQDVFEEECRRRNIKLFVLPPRSPKLNGHVERAHRTHTEEFYEVTDSSFEINELNQALLNWEKVYNTIRPHQALGYLTPRQFLDRYNQKHQKGEVSLIT